MLQAASMYTTGDGSLWDHQDMFDVMLDIAQTSMKLLATDIFDQLRETRNDDAQK